MSDLNPILIKAGDKRVLLRGVPPKADCRVVVEEKWQEIVKETLELREFKERVNKELRLWHLKDCSLESSFRAVDNIENILMEGE